MSLLEKIVKEKALYFSYEYNLSQSVQTIITGILDSEEKKVEEISEDKEEFWKDFDTNYIFNYVQLSFKGLKEGMFLPCIYGYVYIHCVHFDQKKIDYILISRKDC